MSEQERAEAIEVVQLELFTLENEFKAKVRMLRNKIKSIKRSGLKSCRKCREVMNVEQFYEDDRYADGSYPYCKECKRGLRKAA